DRFELYAGGLELANGFVELTDHVQQRERSLEDLVQRQATGKPLYPLDEKFLNSLAEGIPATAGIALGMDRLAMLLWRTDTIATTLTFTQDEL
ncbi:EF-P lysine aminoacylase GenX, partial [Myxococcota bacterium]|nr:EF-P lysine aminoacylase GenX [Myxococcota bacterium]